MLNRLRSLYEAETMKLLGLEKCILGGVAGTLNTSISWYPISPNHLLWVVTIRDRSSGEMVLDSIKLQNRGQKPRMQ